jgi:hypothetical protein
LSSAISPDNGTTWTNVKTLEVCEGLSMESKLDADKVIKPVRARQNVGTLHDGYTFYHYPKICFAGTQVYLMCARGYPKMGVAEQLLHQQEQVLRIYPREWFYG